MIDLHSHILPGIDDGARDVDVSVAMAKLWVADGVTVVAATPHILPGVYLNTGSQILAAIEHLQAALVAADVPLRLVSGADNHMAPDFANALASGHLLSLAGSRYVLVEPPFNIMPPRIEGFFFDLMVAGYVPILTHPERLKWIESHYATFQALAAKGVWMQITAGSLTGAFGRRPQYWAERMLEEGLVHILASDAHGVDKRAPILRAGFDLVATRLGVEAATHMVLTRPQGVLDNAAPDTLPNTVGLNSIGAQPHAMLGADARYGSGTTGHDPGAAAGKPAGGRSFGQRLRSVFDR